jgi:ribosomal protein L17
MSSRQELLEADELKFLCRSFPSLTQSTIESAFTTHYLPHKSEKAWQALLASLDDAKSKSVHPPAAPSSNHSTTTSNNSTANATAGKRKAEDVPAVALPVEAAASFVAAPTTATTTTTTTTTTTAGTTTAVKGVLAAEELVEPIVAVAKKAAVASVTHVTGDLFESKTNLAHCISADAKLGKGIAAHFKSKFGGESFRSRIMELNKRPGEVAAVLAGDRYIYNLVTKPLFYNKPTYDSVRAALRDMKQHMLSNGVKTVALPHGLACGLDGLDWPKVMAMLEEEFDGSGLNVQVFKQPPK